MQVADLKTRTIVQCLSDMISVNIEQGNNYMQMTEDICSAGQYLHMEMSNP